MGLSSYIKKLQGKSDNSKHVIALGSAFVLTALVFSFWVGSIAVPEGGAELAEDTSELPSNTSPFATIGELGEDLVAGVKDTFEAFRSLSE